MIGCYILNRMAELGGPESYTVMSWGRAWQSGPTRAGFESCNNGVSQSNEEAVAIGDFGGNLSRESAVDCTARFLQL